VTLRSLAALLVVAMPASTLAGQDSGEQRPRDAAEAVKEGDVSQWLKYYQRERDAGTPAQQPARSPEPPAEAKAEDAARKR
jgi:hypothetical protein